MGAAGGTSLEGALFRRRQHYMFVISEEIRLDQCLVTGRLQFFLQLACVSG